MIKTVVGVVLVIIVIAAGAALSMLNYEFQNQDPAGIDNRAIGLSSQQPINSDVAWLSIVTGIFILSVFALFIRANYEV
jgi:uncharacterized membrane protein